MFSVRASNTNNAHAIVRIIFRVLLVSQTANKNLTDLV